MHRYSLVYSIRTQVLNHLHVRVNFFRNCACVIFNALILRVHANIIKSFRLEPTSIVARIKTTAGLDLSSVLSAWASTRKFLEGGSHLVPIQRVATILSTLPTKDLMLKLVKVSSHSFFHVECQLLLANGCLRSGALRLFRHIGFCSVS